MKKGFLCKILLAVLLFAFIDKSDAQDTTAISNLRAQCNMLLKDFQKMSSKAIICCSSAQCDQTREGAPPADPNGPRPVPNNGKNDCWGTRPLPGYEEKCGTCKVPNIDNPKEMEMGVYRIKDEVITESYLNKQRRLLTDIDSLLTRIQSLNVSLNHEVAKYSAISITLLSFQKGFEAAISKDQIDVLVSPWQTIENAYDGYSKIKQNSEELQQLNSMLSVQVGDFLSAFRLGLEDAIKRSGN